jgi:FK506-binding nuclear protein
LVSGDEEDFSLDEDSEDEDVSMTEDASNRFQEVKEDAKPKKAEGTLLTSLAPWKQAYDLPLPAAAPKEVANKKRKAETQETDSKRSTTSTTEKKAATPTAAEKKADQAAKKQKTEAAKPAEKKKEAAEKPEEKSSKKQTLPSGLIIEDFKVGDGPVAKKGKRLGMRYIGKLMNGKQFDANTSGAPFNFRLGAGEVIKGWDQGLEGMKVGGERKLTIPAKLAYGSQKIQGIPAGSTLNFEVKLVSVR